MITRKNWHERMADDMRLRDYSRKTQEAYAREARHFLKHVNKEPHELVEDDLRAYFIHLKEERQLAPSSRNVAVHGLRFFFQHTLQREWPIFELVRVKNPQKLPTVLSEAETWQILNAVRQPVRRMALVTIYGLGLRLGEALRLEAEAVARPLQFWEFWVRRIFTSARSANRPQPDQSSALRGLPKGSQLALSPSLRDTSQERQMLGGGPTRHRGRRRLPGSSGSAGVRCWTGSEE